jgi:hypothetical protein
MLNIQIFNTIILSIYDLIHQLTAFTKYMNVLNIFWPNVLSYPYQNRYAAQNAQLFAELFCSKRT